MEAQNAAETQATVNAATGQGYLNSLSANSSSNDYNEESDDDVKTNSNTNNNDNSWTKHFSDIDLGNGNIVKVNFQDTQGGVSSDNAVDPDLIKAFNNAIMMANKITPITSVTISATTNGKHTPGTNHPKGTAVDINMTNGMYIHSGTDAINILVLSLQWSFEQQKEKRENFGPMMMLKSGQPYINSSLSPNKIAGRIKIMIEHETHIHWSVVD
jgi:hypothetical protein